jgi:hypothetical protein
MATEPRYTFDPVTQTYIRIDTPVTTPVRGLGPLYDAGGGGPESAPVGPGLNMMSPGMAEFGVGAQNIGLGLSSIPSMATQVAGAVVSGVGNAMMGSQVSPVAPDTTQVTGISPNQEPTAALAALNAQSKAEEADNTAQAQQAAAVDAAAAVVGGLVEAGFLNNILPMLAGAALTIGSGGVINPYMSAAIVGGVTGLASGSLEKGLMAGLGAFGGAGIGTALSAAGAAGTAASTTGQVLTPQVANASTIIPQGAAGAGGATSIALPPQPGLFSLANAPVTAPVNATIVPGATGATGGATGLFSAANAPPPPSFSSAVSGVKGLASPEGRAAFMTAADGPMGLVKKAGMAAAPLAGSMFSAEEPDTGGKKPQEYVRPYSFDFKPSAETDPNFKFRTGAPGESTAEQRYFTPEFKGLGVYKGGTEPGPSFYGTPTAEQLALYSKPKDSPLGLKTTRDGLDPEGFRRQRELEGSPGLKAGGLAGLGRGGLRDGAFIVPADVVAHLGNGSNDAGQKILARGLGSRPIKGKGDGMSDSIPTSIEGKQPARVADGEAYIPPEVVKKVGSKRLYAMMDKIRQARTGTKKQAPEVNPRQFMPA